MENLIDKEGLTEALTQTKAYIDSKLSSASGTQLYRHNISLKGVNGNLFYLTLTSSNGTQFETYKDFVEALIEAPSEYSWTTTNTTYSGATRPDIPYYKYIQDVIFQNYSGSLPNMTNYYLGSLGYPVAKTDCVILNMSNAQITGGALLSPIANLYYTGVADKKFDARIVNIQLWRLNIDDVSDEFDFINENSSLYDIVSPL